MPTSSTLEDPSEAQCRGRGRRERNEGQQAMSPPGFGAFRARPVHWHPADSCPGERERDEQPDDQAHPGTVDSSADADGEGGPRNGCRDGGRPITAAERGNPVLADGVADRGQSGRPQVHIDEARCGQRDAGESDRSGRLRRHIHASTKQTRRTGGCGGRRSITITAAKPYGAVMSPVGSLHGERRLATGRTTSWTYH